MKFRLKVLVSTILIILVFNLTGLAITTSISDIKGHWAEQSINNLVGKGVVAGYSDGTFKPNINITRAEFVTLVNRLFFEDTQIYDVDYSDLKFTDWFYKDVAKAKMKGYVSGYPDNTFRPNNPITRAEASAMISRVLKLSLTERDLSSFKDASTIDSWSIPYLAVLAKLEVLQGYPDGEIKAMNRVTRAEAVSLLLRSSDIYSKGIDDEYSGEISDINVINTGTDYTFKIEGLGNKYALRTTLKPEYNIDNYSAVAIINGNTSNVVVLEKNKEANAFYHTQIQLGSDSDQVQVIISELASEKQQRVIVSTKDK